MSELLGIWHPTKNAGETSTRHLVSVIESKVSPAYDKIVYHRSMNGYEWGKAIRCYRLEWNKWVRDHEAKQDKWQTVPPFPLNPAVNSVIFYALDSSGQWHFTAADGEWQTCPNPVWRAHG
jgi:hypothetical protein